MSGLGIYLAVLASLFVGIAAVVVAQATKQMSPIIFIFMTSLISVVFLFVLSLIIKERIDIRKLIRKQFWNALHVILSRTVLGNILLVLGFSLTSAIKAVFLLGLEPAFVAIIGFFLVKEKLTGRQIGLMVLLFLGAFLLSTGGSIGVFERAQIGDILIAGALVLFAYSYFPSQKVLKQTNAITLTLFANTVGGIILIFIAFLLFNVRSIELTQPNMVLVITHALLFSAFALFCIFTALKTVKPWVVSSLLQLAPIPGAILAFLWLGDMLGQVQLVGAILILVSSFLIAREHHS